MLLLLLGIIFLHLAALVLLFVSTIVSVSENDMFTRVSVCSDVIVSMHTEQEQLERHACALSILKI